MPQTLPRRALCALACQTLLACQSYALVYQPDADRRGVHLDFTVQTPSKADLLFVIDNTGSMASKQAALSQSIGAMLAALAPQDTSYRIGIVSTDAYGFVADCNHVANPAVASNVMSDPRSGALGNCDRPEVLLRRPHDGTLGRLIAAYDPAAFAASNFAAYAPAVQTALAAMVPTGATSGPLGVAGVQGARWVIDRDAIKQEACSACGCQTCNSADPLYDSCALVATGAMVQAYFRANVAGLGGSGFGWAEGLKVSMWAAGIDPEDPNDATALTPAYNLIADGSPNSAPFVDATSGAVAVGSWIRDDALLAVMYVSDEEDCSMPLYLMEQRSTYEEPAEPTGSICNQPQAQAAFLSTTRMASLLQARKQSSARVAIGAIASLAKTGAAGVEGRSAQPQDCALPQPAAAVPSASCACLADSADARWCALTDLHDNALPGCSGAAARRYVALANSFTRRTFESICRNDATAYSAALSDFARVATLACFDLGELRPYLDDPANVVVRRAPKGSVAAPTLLPMTAPNAAAAGWYYDADNNKICLTGIDRTIGDVYDIFVLDTARRDFSR